MTRFPIAQLLTDPLQVVLIINIGHIQIMSLS
jgi:hypothetical protein